MAEATASIHKVTAAVVKLIANRELFEKDEFKFYQMLEKEILHQMDMELMGKLVLKEHWKTANEEQRTKFLSGFKAMILESYGKSLLLLSDIEIEFIPMPDSQKKRKYQIVHTQILSSSNELPLTMDYYLIKRDHDWKIFDLVIGGASIVQQFRQGFREEIADTSFDSLVQRLNTDFRYSTSQ